MVKLQQKISGSWRTLEGSPQLTAPSAATFLDDAKERDRDVPLGLQLLFEGDVWLPGVVLDLSASRLSPTKLTPEQLRVHYLRLRSRTAGMAEHVRVRELE